MERLTDPVGRCQDVTVPGNVRIGLACMVDSVLSVYKGSVVHVGERVKIVCHSENKPKTSEKAGYVRQPRSTGAGVSASDTASASPSNTATAAAAPLYVCTWARSTRENTKGTTTKTRRKHEENTSNTATATAAPQKRRGGCTVGEKYDEDAGPCMTHPRMAHRSASSERYAVWTSFLSPKRPWPYWSTRA